MPSAPQRVSARGEAERPPATREYESFDSYEQLQVSIPAGGAFIEVGTFSGRPDKVVLEANGVPIIFRVHNRGEAAPATIRVLALGPQDPIPGYEIVEAQDPGGAGGFIVTARGLYASRHIDRRASRRGPLRTTVHDYETSAPEQVTPR